MSLDTSLDIPNLHHGTPVKYMLTRMTNEELEHLREITCESFGEQAAVFADWVQAVVYDELDRREEQNDSIYREPTYPHIPALQWRGEDLGEALVAANVLSYSLNDSEPGNFIDKVVMSLAAVCRHQLAKLK